MACSVKPVAAASCSHEKPLRTGLTEQAISETKANDLDAAYEARKTELEAAVVRSQDAVRAREEQLEARQKDLEDRDSKHARRELRRLLQNELKLRGQQFSLTTGTSGKRRGVHLLFAGLLVLGVAFITVTLIQSWADPLAPIPAIRLALGVLSVLTTLVFYIRWVDSWFRQHADEEFRLKRMSPDVDRASWVVETAMEWQQQNKGSIPAQLLDQLSRELFVTGGPPAVVRHPAEELLSAALATASGLKIKLPNGGEASFDRRAARKLQERMEEPNAGETLRP
jgi:hypothetical protein